jgi:hypothetical protein
MTKARRVADLRSGVTFRSKNEGTLGPDVRERIAASSVPLEL